jgi:hypothetical protein
MMKKITTFDDLNEMMSKGLMSEAIKAAALESTNQLLARNGIAPIELAKESIKRKEETRMVRAKNE